MLVRDGMSAEVLTVGPGHTLREAAAAMCAGDSLGRYAAAGASTATRIRSGEMP